MSAASEPLERALAKARAAGAADADAVLVRSDELEARVRDREVEFVKQAREHRLGLRVFVEKPEGCSQAVVSTSDLAPDAVTNLAEEALALARATAPDPAAGLPEGGFAPDIPDLALLDAADRGVALEARIDAARRAEQAARALDPRIVNSEGSDAGSSFHRVVYGNTRGFLGEYESATHSLHAVPVARENGSMQRAYWFTAGRRLADLDPPEAVGREAARRALRRLGARRVPTAEVPVIFDPTTAPSLLGHLTQAVSGGAVYRGMSCLAERMGEVIASERVHVIDDGRMRGRLGSHPFDGEGLPTRRTEVVRAGRLSSWLLDTYSARRLGMESTGNAARSTGSGPTVAPTNLWLEPGEGTLEDLVAETPRGLLVVELIGMGFNPVTGDYSRGAAGLWIEGGEIVHAVEEVTIAGNLGDMLLAIDRIADDARWQGRLAAPSLRVAAMTVAGE